jgi:hypothetical protein
MRARSFLKSVVAVVLVAAVAWAEPPVSNPAPTPESFEFPQTPATAPETAPSASRGVHKAAFFTCAVGTVVLLVLGIVMTEVAQNDAHTAAGTSVFTTSADSLSERSQIEALVATGGWIGAALLAVAALLLIPVTRWND